MLLFEKLNADIL